MATKPVLNKFFSEQIESVTIKDFNQYLTLIRKIKIGNQQSINGYVISDEKLEQEITKWFE